MGYVLNLEKEHIKEYIIIITIIIMLQLSEAVQVQVMSLVMSVASVERN